MKQTVEQVHARRRTEFRRWLGARKGIAHSSEARAAGFSDREVANAVAVGLAGRVHRSWLVAPTCDPNRAAAASVGGRATCVTAAAMLGLAVPEHDIPHVAVAGNSSRLDGGKILLHWAHGPAPVGRTTVEEPILNILFQAARCLDRPDALALWESAIRKGLVDATVLRRVAWRSTRAAALARVAEDLSDSGLETRFFDGMRESGVAVRRQVKVDGRRIDCRIGDSLLVQLDGFAFHSSAADRRRDLEADARLALRGYTVLRFDFYQVFFCWQYVLDTILTAIAQGAHRRQVR